MKYLGKIEHDKDLINKEYGDDHYLQQLETMPTASADWEDKVVQYVGSDTADFLKGRLYVCNLVSGSYQWDIAILSEGDYVPEVTSIPSPTDYGNKKIMYNGDEGTGIWKRGFFYSKISHTCWVIKYYIDLDPSTIETGYTTEEPSISRIKPIYQNQACTEDTPYVTDNENIISKTYGDYCGSVTHSEESDPIYEWQQYAPVIAGNGLSLNGATLSVSDNTFLKKENETYQTVKVGDNTLTIWPDSDHSLTWCSKRVSVQQMGGFSNSSRAELFNAIPTTNAFYSYDVASVRFSASESPDGSASSFWCCRLAQNTYDSVRKVLLVATRYSDGFSAQCFYDGSAWGEWVFVNPANQSLTAQTRESVVKLATARGSGITINLTNVCFTAEESPTGSASTTFDVEAHSNGSAAQNYGYILAKHRSNFYLCYVSGTSYGDWKQVTFHDGGTMHGDLIFTSKRSVKSEVTTGYMNYSGGTGWSGGATLALYGSECTDTSGGNAMKGGFRLKAYKKEGETATYREMQGFPDGTLTWDGKTILTCNNTLGSLTADSTYIQNNQCRYFKYGRIVTVVVNIKTANATAIASEKAIGSGLPNPASGMSTYFPCYANDKLAALYINSSGQLVTNLSIASATNGLWVRGTITYLAGS